MENQPLHARALEEKARIYQTYNLPELFRAGYWLEFSANLQPMRRWLTGYQYVILYEVSHFNLCNCTDGRRVAVGSAKFSSFGTRSRLCVYALNPVFGTRWVGNH